MKLGHNIFLTGEPGAGKTHTINEFIRHCNKNDIGIGVTASTGIAATHIGGMTIHSWSGIGINSQLSEEQIERLSERSQLKSRFKKTRVLIIDEISMFDGARLNLVNQVCKVMKKSHRPFGGLQIILCGDLFQLPPVTRYSQQIDFAHTSEAWAELNLKTCYLSEQHRQNDDETMLNLLRQIRSQSVSEDSLQLLEERLASEDLDERTTRLYSHNMNVDELNNRRLAQLDTESKMFTMLTSGSQINVEQLKKSCLAPEVLELKVGAQVLCVANNASAGYVNGSRGEVIDFDLGKPVVRLKNGKDITMERVTWKMEDHDRVLAEVSQYPLRLAWAITVHKSQGMSLDAAEVDLSRAFTPGMGYVALSRLRSLEGLYLKGINQTALQVSQEISMFDAILKRQSQQVLDSLESIAIDSLDDMHQKIRTNLSSDYAEYDKNLFENFRNWRTQVSKDKKLPAYMILDDKTLIALSAEKPKNEKELLKVSGIGPKKFEQYGHDIMTLINQSSGKLL